ncbi:PREDICTED: protein mab-21-like 2 [Corvus brachyrhynchos]|nr:PREDICTED: protein mab-21-like 2 [Corvus brachyrhynchos]
MIAAQAKLVYQLNKYYTERCQARKAAIAKTIREVCKVVSDVLKEVEVQEPRFISSLSEIDARYEGLEVISPTEFEVVLYLNQMGVFNFVDDGSLPGCAVLKLSDGRKRSMSLWVEFITASGYLSARKIRSRFQTLVAQAVDKCSYRDVVKMIADTSEVKLRIRERYVVQITPAFKCTGIWPRSAAQWPMPHIPWPGPNRVAEVKAEGFNLLSKECYSLTGKQSSAESDAWVLQFGEAENRLLVGGGRLETKFSLAAAAGAMERGARGHPALRSGHTPAPAPPLRPQPLHPRLSSTSLLWSHPSAFHSADPGSPGRTGLARGATLSFPKQPGARV